ncbi:uncharacterized protein ATNIH1004_009399 [Aspergillus tanneri]|uniref:Uncharacterized protein n=1 Tax=Aspergillus tanneri TaxID=1220188 RepID=A0A5M9MDX7_9EURO|nr:uncharacterized protein ATNIH1004_009399 [Aspergillus tanneri]KAA8645182.1 hypothetical protein ATNIH1004_009399 [Aspergillus tanneri]
MTVLVLESAWPTLELRKVLSVPRQNLLSLAERNPPYLPLASWVLTCNTLSAVPILEPSAVGPVHESRSRGLRRMESLFDREDSDFAWKARPMSSHFLRIHQKDPSAGSGQVVELDYIPVYMLY